MKITGVRTLVVNAAMRNWVFVQVRTDQPGLDGWGEATLEWKTRAVAGAVEDLTPLVLGRDPRDVEQLVRVLTKHSFWRLGVIGNSAISGIETACWDIFAKSLGVPVWRLLGGRTRDRVPVYTHLGLGEMTAVYESLDEAPLVERAREVVERGYRALKAVFIPYTHYTASPRQIDKVARCMARDPRGGGRGGRDHGRLPRPLRLGLGGAAVYRGDRPVPPAVRRGAAAARRDAGAGRAQGQDLGPDRFRRAAGRPARVRRGVPRACHRHRPAGPLPCRRLRRGPEDRRHGRERQLRGGAAQPAWADRRRGGAALRRRHAKLRDPGGDGGCRALVP